MKHILRIVTGLLVTALVIIPAVFLTNSNLVHAKENAASQAMHKFYNDTKPENQNIADMLQGKHRIPQEIKQLYDNAKAERPTVEVNTLGATSLTKITANTTLSADKTYNGEVDIYPSVTYNVNHKNLTVNGDLYIYGFVDLKGGTLKVNGNLIIASTSDSSIGQLFVDGGSVIVSRSSNNSDSGNLINAGQLSMLNLADKVTVTNGDFLAGGVDSRSYLGAGTIDINGNFAQLGLLHPCSFAPEDTLKVIIRGTASAPRDIYFDSPGESYFANYQFAAGTVLTQESIVSLKLVLSADTSITLPNVLVYYFGSLNGYALTLNGGAAYITSPNSSLNFGGGKVTVNGTSGFGDYSDVQMTNAADKFVSNGDFLAGSSYATLMNGKLEVNGDFYQLNTNNDANTFTPGPLFTTQFYKKSTYVNFENPNISYFTNLVLATGASFTEDSVIPLHVYPQQDVISTPINYPNLYLSGNLNGHTLTVDCDFTIVQSLDINGGRLLAEHDVVADGCLKMKKDADYVCVGGNYTITSNTYNYQEITAGTLELKGNFLATPENPNSSNKTFVAGGTHKTILEGTNKRVIFGDPVNSHFANVEIAEGTTFSPDSVISMYTEFAKDYTFNVPTLYLSGSLRGHTVNVNGNLYAMTYLSIDKGTLNVSGNLTTNGNLYMRDNEDIVHVKGNYTMTGGTNYSTLTKGTLYIEGNFRQSGASGLFTAASPHKTVFCGKDVQTISFDAPATSKFGIVDIANDKVTYTSLPCDTKIISCTNLSDISATSGTLYPSFDRDTLSYILIMPKGTTSTSLNVTAPNGNEIVTMDGTTGTAKQLDNIPYGGNIPVSIAVTTSGSMITKTYTVKVEQLNTDISGVAVSNGSLNKPFDADTIDYTIELPASAETISLTPTIGNTDASFTMDGQKATAKTISIHPGETKTCAIQVTGQDGSTTKTYTFTIHRAPLIDNIEITGGALSPAFAYATDTYAVDLPITDSNVSISVSKSAECDVLTMDGTEQNSLDIALSQVGQSKTVSIVAKAADSNITHTYTVAVTRTPLLTSLGLPGTANLSEKYTPTTFAYTLTLPSSTTSATLTPAVSQYCDELAIKCGNGEFAAQTSQTVFPDFGETIPVQIRITDTADNIEQTYTVNVYRLPIITKITSQELPDSMTFSPTVHSYEMTVPANIGTLHFDVEGIQKYTGSVDIRADETKTITISNWSADNHAQAKYDIKLICVPKPLTSISLSNVSLITSFDASKRIYNVDIGSTIKTLTLSAVKSGSCSKLLINGTECTSATIPLPIGNTPFLIQATDQGSNVVTTYTIYIDRSHMLTSITPSVGTLSPAFDPATDHYVLIMPPNKDKVNFELAKSPSCTGTYFNGEGPLVSVATNTHKQVKITADNYHLDAASNYIIDIYNMNSITGIQASKGTFSPVFAAGTQNYTLTLPATESTTTITPTVTETCKSMTINGDAASSKTFTLSKVGESTTATISITALDNTTSTYNLSIIRSALITNITTSPGALNSAFSPTASSYTIDVPATATQVKITPAKARAGVKSMTINGKSASSITLKPAIGGNATADIIATATDGITSARYTVTVRRAALVTNISVSAGSLSFSPTTLTYTVNVPADAGSITLNAAQAASGVKSITINGAALASVNLTPPIGGAANATIIGTATGGKVKITYTVLVKRAPILSGLTPSTCTLKPVFSMTTTAYIVNLPATISSFTLTPVKAADCSTLLINGIKQDAITVNPAVGESIPITIEGKTALGTTATYNVKVTRAALITSITSGNKKYPISPVFSATTMNYTIDLPASVSSITIKATKATGEAKTLSMNGAAVSSFTAKPTAGGNIIVEIQAVAKDGVTKVTYTVTVRRAALP